jgi:hypothetical protein
MALSATEIKVLNQVSMQRANSVKLGTILSGLLATSGSPVQIAKASKRLTFTGVALHGETLTINNPTVVGTDVFELLTDADQELSDDDNIPVDISSYVAFSSNTLTVVVQPTSGDTFTIGDKVFTFVPVGTANADGEVSVGASLSAAQGNIVKAIKGTDGFNDKHELVTISDFTVNVATVSALIGGSTGSGVATTETFTSGSNVFSAATTGSAADCSAPNAITALLATITGSGTQGVDATASGGSAIDLTASTSGSSGNDIEIAETLSNATFAGSATKLSGGTGVPAVAGEMHFDESYLYVCDGTDWHRISLGSAY